MSVSDLVWVPRGGLPGWKDVWKRPGSHGSPDSVPGTRLRTDRRALENLIRWSVVRLHANLNVLAAEGKPSQQPLDSSDHSKKR